MNITVNARYTGIKAGPNGSCIRPLLRPEMPLTNHPRHFLAASAFFLSLFFFTLPLFFSLFFHLFLLPSPLQISGDGLFFILLSWSIFQPIKDNTVDSVEPVLALTHGIFHLYPILFPPFSFTSATLALPSSPRRLLHLFFLTHSYRSLIITITANFFFNSSRTTTWGRDSSITSIYHFSNRMRNSRFTRTSTRDDPSSWT